MPFNGTSFLSCSSDLSSGSLLPHSPIAGITHALEWGWSEEHVRPIRHGLNALMRSIARARASVRPSVCVHTAARGVESHISRQLSYPSPAATLALSVAQQVAPFRGD